MKPKKRKPARGRRKFKGSKFAGDESAFSRFGQHPRPYGWAGVVSPDENAASRFGLRRFFPPFQEMDARGVGLPFELPPSFAQIADRTLGKKQTYQTNHEIAAELDRFETLNKGRENPQWNYPELPPELLRKAVSQCAAWTVREHPVIQRALARLYAVAWFGRSAESAEAKQQLEFLIPPGRENPITKWFPELAEKFLWMWQWIRESDKLMMQDSPLEDDRVKKLVELYGESKGVISAALRQAENPFLTERLAEVLDIPKETVRKELAKSPASWRTPASYLRLVW